MIRKNVTRTGVVTRVTFKYPNEEGAKSAAVAGEFNNWSVEEHPMKQLKDGSFSATISLKTGASYKFRYVLDDKNWVNDPDADTYIANDYGSNDSVVEA